VVAYDWFLLKPYYRMWYRFGDFVVNVCNLNLSNSSYRLISFLALCFQLNTETNFQCCGQRKRTQYNRLQVIFLSAAQNWNLYLMLFLGKRLIHGLSTDGSCFSLKSGYHGVLYIGGFAEVHKALANIKKHHVNTYIAYVYMYREDSPLKLSLWLYLQCQCLAVMS
jgi:hypothetical protein